MLFTIVCMGLIVIFSYGVGNVQPQTHPPFMLAHKETIVGMDKLQYGMVQVDQRRQ